MFKRLLIALLLLPILSHAKTEIGIGGGVSFNSRDLNTSYFGNTEKLKANPAFYGKVLFGDRWQLGANVSIVKWSNRIPGVAFWGGTAFNLYLANPAVVLCFEANRRVEFYNSAFYFGLAAGACYLKGTGKPGKNFGYVDENIYPGKNGKGFVAGGQIGYTINLTSSYASTSVGLNIEAAPRFGYGIFSANAKDMTLIYCPVTLGLRVKI